MIICRLASNSLNDSSKSSIANSKCILEVSAGHCRTCKHVSLLWRYRGHRSWVHSCSCFKTLPMGTNPFHSFVCHFNFIPRPFFHLFVNSKPRNCFYCSDWNSYWLSCQYKSDSVSQYIWSYISCMSKYATTFLWTK